MEFLRSKQSGVQHDFTGDLLTSDLFILDEVAKYGLDSTISTLAYDPVQSLLAIGTVETATSPGSVHVFGQKRVHVQFTLQRKGSVKHLRLCDSKIIVLDSKNELTVFDMEMPGAPGISNSPPSVVTAVLTDPALDWAFLGLQNGEVLVYDIDREVLSPFKIQNFWRERAPRARLLPVVSLALHPRDVGTLLIGYTEGAVVYSLKRGEPVHFLQFELPPGAPGADTEAELISTLRKPRLSQGLWHPTGSFIMTTYEDSCMAFWDPKDGRIVQTRTLQDAGVHLPRRSSPSAFGSQATAGSISLRQPLFKVAWCCTSNPDDTSILIAGGNEISMPAKGMTLFDLGPTPNMVTSSWEIIGEHLATPRRQRVLPTPTDLDVVDFCLIPRTSPHYAGSQDPVAVIALLSSSELVILGFPDGQPLSPAKLLHPTLSLAHPFTTHIDVSAVNRNMWLGMVESGDRPKDILIGGIEHQKPLRRYENRTVVQSAHPDGMVRIWDIGHADEIENEGMIELDLVRVLQRGVDVKVECVSMAGATGETAVGMETGEVVIYRWGRNRAFGRTLEDERALKPSAEQTTPMEGFEDVKTRGDPAVKEGLIPFTLLRQNCGVPLVMKMSDVGFLAIAYQTGHLCVVDLRGPTVIFHQSLTTLTKEQKRSSIRKSKEQPLSGEKATVLEFGVLTLEGDEFSSIALFCGTSAGRILTFKLLPAQGGGFSCTPAGATHADGAVVSITPLNSDSGARAWATPQAVANLRDGIKVPGVLVAVTRSEARIFKPPGAKGAHRAFDDGYACAAAGVTELEDYGIVLTILTEPLGTLKSFSLPGLKEIADVPDTRQLFAADRLRDTRILSTGHVWAWAADHAFTLVYLWGKGVRLATQTSDVLYNPTTPAPPRPTISNFAWISGTVHVTAADIDLLIGGPDRPMSRKMKAQEREARAEEQRARIAGRAAGGEEGGQGGTQGQGVWANMMKGVQERTEKLNIVGDSMDNLGEHSASLADDVSKFVNQQKKKVLLGGIAGKFF